MPARSLLFVPANRPDRFAKALGSGADQVVLDLEDAVAPPAKSAARDILVDWLGGPEGRPIVVRVNGLASPWHEDDVRALRRAPNVWGIMLPKTESGDDLTGLHESLGPGRELIGLVESVRGIAFLRDVTAGAGLSRLAFGSVDFCAETGIRGQASELDFVRGQIILESSLAGLAAPIEGVTVDLRDPQALAADVERARRFGFGGKLCIHPAQVASVNAAFSPSEAEIAWAHRVIAAAGSGDGAVAVDGKLVDRPVILQARNILAQSGETGESAAA